MDPNAQSYKNKYLMCNKSTVHLKSPGIEGALSSTAVTIASYRIIRVLAKHKKSSKDGEVVKEVFFEAANALFGDIKKKNDIL